MRSLRSRLVLSLALVLAVLVALTGLALERAFRDAARSAREERLLAQIYLLMAAAESADGTLALPTELAEWRFSFPGSGLAARVFDGEERVVWQSRSALDAPEPEPVSLPAGIRRFVQRDLPDGSGWLVGAFGVSWATGPEPRPYTFAVAEDLRALRSEIAGYRASLYGSLALLSLVMLVALVLALRLGLAPLRRVAREVAALERGAQARILGRYPSELRALTRNLNALIAQEQARRERLDHALGDLAHSLKTPIAVMRGALAEAEGPAPPTGAGRDPDPDGQGSGGASPDRSTAALRELLAEQLARMAESVEYHLRRARAGALHTGALAPPVPVPPTARRLAASLAKVYPERPVELALDLPPDIGFRGTEGDLFELLGNLLDNAWKWSRGRVCLSAVQGPSGLVLSVEDDGPGIPPERAQAILERGVRADESTPGHGLGLALVREICRAYDGTLTIDRSDLGGARIRLHFP